MSAPPRRRRARRAAAGLLLLTLGYIVAVRLIAYPTQQLSPQPEVRFSRGAFHVHSALSDGCDDCTPEFIAGEAKGAGAEWVVFAEHNVVDPRGTRFVDDVLLVASSEISTRAGHVVALGLSREMQEAERRGEPISAIRALGGEPIAAHPLNRKRPYDALDVPGLTGLEVLSADDLFRDAQVSPLAGLPAALAYPFNPAHALGIIVERPAETLARWDSLLRTRRMAGVCSIDAHGYPAYGVEMKALGLYVRLDPTPAGDAFAMESELKHAVALGRAFCGVDLFGSAAGFSFSARIPEREAPFELGDEVELSAKPVLTARLGYASLPRGAHQRLYCDGEVMAESTSGVLSFTPTRACPYRVEVTLAGVNALGLPQEKFWIFSNPIYVR